MDPTPNPTWPYTTNSVLLAPASCVKLVEVVGRRTRREVEGAVVAVAESSPRLAAVLHDTLRHTPAQR